jgi:hypothetical protein
MMINKLELLPPAERCVDIQKDGSILVALTARNGCLYWHRAWLIDPCEHNTAVDNQEPAVIKRVYGLPIAADDAFAAGDVPSLPAAGSSVAFNELSELVQALKCRVRYLEKWTLDGFVDAINKAKDRGEL